MHPKRKREKEETDAKSTPADHRKDGFPIPEMDTNLFVMTEADLGAKGFTCAICLAVVKVSPLKQAQT